MSDSVSNPNLGTLSLASDFDWRAPRTWAVFFGLAIAIGGAFAAILLVFAVFFLDPPSGELSESGRFLRTILMFLFFVLLVVFLRNIAQSTPRAATRSLTRSGGSSLSAWLGSGLDVLLEMLWLVLALLTCAALVRLGGPYYDPLKTERAAVFGVILNLGLILQSLPALLQRWARPKALPARYPHEQADAGRERRP